LATLHGMLQMLRKILPVLLVPLLFTGCASTFSNLTPKTQMRNANNLYPIEVAFHSRQQSLRWETIQPQVNVGGEFYPMRPTLLMTNRWEAIIPVPSGKDIVRYRYKFSFKYNAVGDKPQEDSALSPEYTLRISDK
jgi:hypothetical protein